MKNLSIVSQFDLVAKVLNHNAHSSRPLITREELTEYTEFLESINEDGFSHRDFGWILLCIKQIDKNIE